MTILHVYANRSNVGDWLSARGIQAALAHHTGAPVVEALCDGPFMPGLDAALAGHDGLVVVGGGGLVMDYFTPLWQLLDAHVDRLPVVIWGIGVVELTQEPSLPDRALVRRVAERAAIRVVRDARTAEFLGGDTTVSPCPALLAVPASPVQEQGVCHSANFTTVGERAYTTMRERLMRWADQTGRAYLETNNRIEPGREGEMAATLQRYERADVVASSRLHGCLISLAMGRPVAAVSGDRKVDELMSQAGLSDWLVPHDRADEIVDLVQALDGQPRPHAYLTTAAADAAATAAQVAALLAAHGADTR